MTTAVTPLPDIGLTARLVGRRWEIRTWTPERWGRTSSHDAGTAMLLMPKDTDELSKRWDERHLANTREAWAEYVTQPGVTIVRQPAWAEGRLP